MKPQPKLSDIVKNPKGRIPAVIDDGESAYGDSHIKCPVCGDMYVHHRDWADVIDGNDNYEASGNVRGNVIAMPMYCESGHKFVFCLGFHKGHTFVWCASHTRKIARA